jgi:hypothetical protein
MMRKSFALTLAATGLALAFLAVAQPAMAGEDDDNDLHPTGKGWGERHNGGQGNAAVAPAAVTNGIIYHGGPVMVSPSNRMYYIWYGNWSGNTATTILTDLANGIGGSPYFNINTTYFNASNVHVRNAMLYGGAIFNNYSLGTALTDANIRTIVTNSIGPGKLPSDPNAVYFVLTSADVNATSGFCTQYCGWHAHAAIGGADIKYSFVGNPARCPASCTAQGTVSPNGNVGADGMASIIAHELEEAVSDPDLNAWFDRLGAENADKCAWTFGTTYPAGGALANMRLGARDYLIQRNWVNASGGFCAKAFP